MNTQQQETIFQNAVRAHQQGQLSQARDLYLQLERACAEQADLLYLLGRVNLELGRADESSGYFWRMVQLYPSDDRGRINLAIALEKEGRTVEAIRAYRAFIRHNPTPEKLKQALPALIDLMHPGEDYLKVLGRFHDFLRPERYLEIGVDQGKSLAVVRPPTVAVGIDPAPKVDREILAQSEIYPFTSDDFFQKGDVWSMLNQQPIELAFIDGLHIFEAALRDFMHVEKYCRKQSVVLIHDCVPIDAVTSERDRQTQFWSGDIWKVVAVLRKYRPELEVFTIPTRPTGLGVVTNLCPDSTVLWDCYEQILSEYIPQSYDDIAEHYIEALKVIPNNWEAVLSRIEQGWSRA